MAPRCDRCNAELTPLIVSWFCGRCEAADAKRWYAQVKQADAQPGRSAAPGILTECSIAADPYLVQSWCDRHAQAGTLDPGVVVRVKPIGTIRDTPFDQVFKCPDAIVIEVWTPQKAEGI